MGLSWAHFWDTFSMGNAWKKSSDLGWGVWWRPNSAQTACPHSVYLEMPETDNERLGRSITYTTAASQSAVLEGHRCHDGHLRTSKARRLHTQ